MVDKAKPIFVIEDNAPIRKLLSTILKKAGFDTMEFPDGATALEEIKVIQPLAIILDILLPDYSGTDVLKIIRELPNGKTVPIVAVTGFGKTSDREKYLDFGFDSYFSKPIDAPSFADNIIKVIEEKQKLNL